MTKAVFIWRIPIALTDLVEEYKIKLEKEKIEELAKATPSLDQLYEKCEATRRELNIQDKNFSIKLFLAVMFNVLRLYWVVKSVE